MPPEDRFENDCYFYDMGEEFELEYEGSMVVSVAVEGTDAYPFYLQGFDVEAATLAIKQCDLPHGIKFNLDNGVIFGLYGDWIEYFIMELEKENDVL